MLSLACMRISKSSCSRRVIDRIGPGLSLSNPTIEIFPAASHLGATNERRPWRPPIGSRSDSNLQRASSVPRGRLQLVQYLFSSSDFFFPSPRFLQIPTRSLAGTVKYHQRLCTLIGSSGLARAVVRLLSALKPRYRAGRPPPRFLKLVPLTWAATLTAHSLETLFDRAQQEEET